MPFLVPLGYLISPLVLFPFKVIPACLRSPTHVIPYFGNFLHIYFHALYHIYIYTPYLLFIVSIRYISPASFSICLTEDVYSMSRNALWDVLSMQYLMDLWIL